MSTLEDETRPIRVCVVSIALSIAFGSLSTSLQPILAQARKATDTTSASRRMADGKQWTTQNLDVKATPSYCYDNAELNCRRYGRLYPWESARRVCQTLGDGWRLPTEDEWRQMAKHYGGVSEDSDDKGEAAYKALFAGGSSGFNALLGGGRADDGQYARLEAHGFYWTASEIDVASGWFYNFGKGGQALHRQSGGEKPRSFSVRCVKE
ncbi:MAG: FISUMP domain-containing protein [Acidobacteriota bacterium]